MINDLRYEPYFLYTQNSISTFKTCPLKFKKRYLDNLKWDSKTNAEINKQIEIGKEFHLIACRYFLNVDTELENTENNGALDTWVQNLKYDFPKNPQFRYLPEYKIRMAWNNIRLEANYDLLIISPDNKIEIWDFKTHNEKSNNKNLANKLIESFQTAIYMYVLKNNAKLLIGDEIKCNDISMHYWQPQPKKIISTISYDAPIYGRHEQLIKNVIEDIFNYDYDAFDKELYKENCRYCEFNWLCNNIKTDFKIDSNDDFLDDFCWDDIEEKF